MTIAEKLLTIADNTPAVAEAVNAAKFTASGSSMVINDVLDVVHPLEVHANDGAVVKVYGKNLFNIADRVVRNFGAISNTTQRTFTDNSVYLNLSCNNYCVANHKMSYEKISDNSFTVLIPSNSQSGWEAYGAGFNFRVKPNTSYSVSVTFDSTKGKCLGCAFYDKDGNYISNTSKTEDITTPNNCMWMNVILGVQVRDEAVLFENVMLEIGSSATEYTSYKEPQTATADASGKAEGLRSVYPTMTLVSDAFVECAYFPLSSALKYEKYQQLKQAEKDLKESISQ